MTSLEQLVRDEGLRYTAYQDSRGVWTLGMGHNLTVPISHDVALQIARDDLLAAETACLTLPFWSQLSEPRQGVVRNMVFNLGLAGFSRFPKLRAALVAGDYERAATEMLDSTWAKQVGARAHRLATQMRTDVWT